MPNIIAYPLNFKKDGGEMIFNLPNGLQGYFLNEVCCKHGDAMQIAFDEFIWIHKKQSMSPNGYNRVLDGVGSGEAHHTDKETTQ